jgi:hypothetical protein
VQDRAFGPSRAPASAGAGEVVIIEPSPWLRDVTTGLGLTVVRDGATVVETIEPLTDGEGAD